MRPALLSRKREKGRRYNEQEAQRARLNSLVSTLPSQPPRRNPYAGSPVPPKRRPGPGAAARCRERPPADLLKGIEEFNRGLFFEQHETLEGLWRAERDEIRYLYQGILVVGVGCYHLLRGNFHGATAKLRLGVELLQPYRPSCQTVDVAGLIADAERLLAEVESLGRERVGDFDRTLIPKVRLTGHAGRSEEIASSRE